MFLSKKMRGSIRSGADLLFVTSFLFFAGIGIYFVYNLQEKNIILIKEHSTIMPLNEKLDDIERDNQNNLLYGEGENYTVFSSEKIFQLCFPKLTTGKELTEEEEEYYEKFPDLLKLVIFKSVPVGNITNKTQIAQYHTPNYFYMKCNNFSFKQENLYYKNKPVYFLLNKLQEKQK